MAFYRIIMVIYFVVIMCNKAKTTSPAEKAGDVVLATPRMRTSTCLSEEKMSAEAANRKIAEFPNEFCDFFCFDKIFLSEQSADTFESSQEPVLRR